jgi:multisubunit Na+/H+ antiporter MnhB subunit
MGYGIDTFLSIPLAIILYTLIEKIIINMTSENNYEERVQKSFIISFIVGFLFILLAMTVFGKDSNLYNHTINLSFYITGVFMILNSVLFSWSDLDEGTKIIILGITMMGIIMYAYSRKKKIIKLMKEQ